MALGASVAGSERTRVSGGRTTRCVSERRPTVIGVVRVGFATAEADMEKNSGGRKDGMQRGARCGDDTKVRWVDIVHICRFHAVI